MSQKLLPQRHITSDLADAFVSLSRMASCFIRDTEENQVGGFVSAACLKLFGGQSEDIGFCLSLCLCVSVVQKGFLS